MERQESVTPSRPYIGGQAVIEGVMMRAPGGVAVAVRRPDGSVVVKDGPLPSSLRAAFWKWPGLRGIGTLYESLSLGYGALQFSADQQEQGATGGPGGGLSAMLPTLLLPWTLAQGPDVTDGPTAPQEPPTDGGSGGSRVAMIVSSLFALGLFIALPQLLATLAGRLAGVELGLSDFRFHALTGGFKLVVLTAYLGLISRIDEIRRVFQYHGAEHKTIFAYEAGLPLDVANVRAQSTLHPRCGTTFLIVVVIVSVLVGSIVTPLVLPGASGLGGQAATLALRISLLPLIAAISYELQRASARYCTTGPLRVLLYPGFLFQKITTREPDDAQIEIAIASMEAAVWRNDRADAAAEVRVFPSLEAARARTAGAPTPG
jgi:uncharacterized protein YqhQ